MEITRVLDAALRKAGAVWVAAAGQRPRLVWTVWRDGALWVAVGPDQQVPGLTDGTVGTVTVRSPSTHSRLVEFLVTVTLAEPDEATNAALVAAHLNRPPNWTEVYRLDLAE